MATRLSIHSLRVRLAFGTGTLFTVLIAATFAVIYSASSKFRQDDFYARLRDRVLTTYKLYVEVDAIDSSLLKLIDSNTANSAIPQQSVQVYRDTALVYFDYAQTHLTPGPRFFPAIKQAGELFYKQGGYEVEGLYREYKGHPYYILSSGYDLYGFRKLDFLKWTMLLACMVAIGVGWTAIYFFVKKAVQPLDNLQTNIARIDYNSLDIRLSEKGQGEEVNNLAANFNQLLSRLEKSFLFQKDFVHYASHELRTPLSVMIGLTETTLNGEKTPLQYRQTLRLLLQQQKNLTDITNSLLLLATTNDEAHKQNYPLERLDEMVFRAAEISQGFFPAASISVNVESLPVDEKAFLLPCHEPLLMMAFTNLIKNALQYSADNKATVVMNISEQQKELRFLNNGVPVLPEERERIFTPFYRASTTGAVKGYGLGLPLAKQILRLHGGIIHYTYAAACNVFVVRFA